MIRLFRIAVPALLAAVLLVVPAAAQRLSVTESVHDLSPSGPGPVRGSEGFACLFCHAPHNVLMAKAPLWNHELSTQVYTPYTSTTYRQTGEQPQLGASSKLCLSCHDGSVALGQTVSQGAITVTGGLDPSDNFGSDVRDSHPFSFATPMVDNGELRPSLFLAPPQTADPSVRLVNGRVECTTCHEPHTPNLDPVAQKFLVRDASGGQLCLACHDPARSTATRLQGWSAGQHATASHAVNAAAGAGSYATVAANACFSCHAPHNAGAGGRLLRQPEENTCALCHRGTNLSPALPDVMNAFVGSLYRHPVDLSGLHDPAEDAFPLNSSRHAECADCHNPHSAQGGSAALPPAVPQSLIGASGVSGVDGITPLPRATNQYEVCFKCHANSTGKPQSETYLAYGRTPYRQNFAVLADPYNTRLDLLSTIARHNVMQPARSGVAPSLRTNMLDLSGSAAGRSLAVGTYLYCTDCHNHSGARNVGGAAASGPHGSDYEHLLERRYDLEPLPASPGGSSSGVPYVSGPAGSYALCDKCHDIDNRLLSGDPVFGEHRKHVVGERSACATCHAPHGVQNGTPQANQHLLNPDTRIVGPNGSGQLRIDTSARTCSLRCHGQNHNNESY